METNADVKALVYDHASGSREIAERALHLVQRMLLQSRAEEAASLVDDVATTGVHLVRAHPDMPQVFHAFNRLVLAGEAAERAPGAPLADVRLALLQAVGQTLQSFDQRLAKIADAAMELVPNGGLVVTTSRSSTVEATLLAARRADRHFDVVVPESRPMLEGRTLARTLSEHGVPVRLIVDALAPEAVEGADVLLAGADALAPSGFVNKIGTRVLARCAKDADVPTWVVAEGDKAWVNAVDPRTALHANKTYEPREVWDQAPMGVEVVNRYFEFVPYDAVNGLVTEHGKMVPAEFWAKERRRAVASRLQQALGDDLALKRE